jgi:hypothetical protein
VDASRGLVPFAVLQINFHNLEPQQPPVVELVGKRLEMDSRNTLDVLNKHADWTWSVSGTTINSLIVKRSPGNSMGTTWKELMLSIS